MGLSASNLAPKRKPGQRTGHTLRVAAQYIQKTPKNNGLFGIRLIDFGMTGMEPVANRLKAL